MFRLLAMMLSIVMTLIYYSHWTSINWGPLAISNFWALCGHSHTISRILCKPGFWRIVQDQSAVWVDFISVCDQIITWHMDLIWGFWSTTQPVLFLRPHHRVLIFPLASVALEYFLAAVGTQNGLLLTEIFTLHFDDLASLFAQGCPSLLLLMMLLLLCTVTERFLRWFHCLSLHSLDAFHTS